MEQLNTDKFQGMCLVSAEGHKFMFAYDGFPPSVRDKLKYSPYNICPICVSEVAKRDEISLHQAIDYFEASIRINEQFH